MVDVEVQAVFSSSVEAVSSYACDPSHAPTWYVNIQSVEWLTAPPVQVGSQMAFVAHFLGRRLAYTYEVTELVPGERMVMRTAEGPFPMQTTYVFASEGTGSRMTLRNQGEPKGFSRLMAPLMARMMRRAMTRDLAKLREILDRA